MRLFLDASVLLAACNSDVGASRELFHLARDNSWDLLVCPYVLSETTRNLQKMRPEAAACWPSLRAGLLERADVLTLDRPSLLMRSKDKPVLFSALAWADVLLTLDRRDFGDFMNTTMYGLPVFMPGDFLENERAKGRLIE